MQVELSTAQVLFVEELLSGKGLEYVPLKEELLDHICCMIETKMAEGFNFHVASKMVFDSFGKDEWKKLQDQTIYLLNQKKLSMKKTSILVLGFLLTTVTVLWAINMDPPNSSPLEENYSVTSAYGMRVHPIFKEKKMHRGIDLKAPIGTPVYATADGVVEAVKNHKSGYGKHIIIKHDEVYQSLYAQLSEIKVKTGQSIKKGDLIGLVGSSGASTGPHLHYEVIKDGKKVNPIDYMGP